MTDKKEVAVRLLVPKEIHDRLRNVQGLIQYRKGDKVTVAEAYVHVVETGLAQIEKKNK